MINMRKVHSPQKSRKSSLIKAKSSAFKSRKTPSRLGLTPNAVRKSRCSKAGHSKRQTFPMKLFNLLESNKHTDAICWNLDGKVFSIKNKELLETVLPDYFGHCRIRSLQRQFSFWGFNRIPAMVGKSEEEWYHPLFREGRRDMVRMVTRIKLNPSSMKSKKQTTKEVDCSSGGSSTSKTAITSTCANQAAFVDAIPNNDEEMLETCETSSKLNIETKDVDTNNDEQTNALPKYSPYYEKRPHPARVSLCSVGDTDQLNAPLQGTCAYCGCDDLCPLFEDTLFQELSCRDCVHSEHAPSDPVFDLRKMETFWTSPHNMGDFYDTTVGVTPENNHGNTPHSIPLGMIIPEALAEGFGTDMAPTTNASFSTPAHPYLEIFDSTNGGFCNGSVVSDDQEDFLCSLPIMDPGYDIMSDDDCVSIGEMVQGEIEHL